MRRLTLVALLLLAPAFAPPADACGVPCGKIYPSIILQFAEGLTPPFPAKVGVPVVLDATLTYRFDAQQDGYGAVQPNEPVFITFEYPRKPAWADLAVEPQKIEVPVNDPRFFAPKPDPNAAELHWIWSTPIKITATVTGQAVLKDGYDYAKLLVFAKSAESGIYQAGYGIKEVRLVPEGAVHESDVAGTRDVFTASPLPTLDLAPVERSFLGVKATLEPPEGAKFWASGTWRVTLDPTPAGRVALAMHDESGNLVATAGPMPAAPTLALNATLARPGLHTVTVTLLPDAGQKTPPVTLALDVQAGALDADGFAYDKLYVVQTSGPFPTPAGNPDPRDITGQWERDIPFFAFDSAQSVNAIVTLSSPTVATATFTIIDPDGKLLMQGSVDPNVPQKSQRIGSVPMEGWYVLRLRGVGAPVQTTWDARIEVAYANPPQARNRADGAPDETDGVLALAARNLTLPLAELGVWQPSSIQPTLEVASTYRYAITVVDANGTLAYASGLRTGKASFTPPSAGTFRAFAYAEPIAPGVPFSPLVRAFTFTVGAGQVVTAAKFPLQDEPLAPTSPTEGVIALYGVPILDGAGDPTVALAGGRVELVDDAGAPVSSPEPGRTYVLRALAANPGPAKTLSLDYAIEYAAPQTFTGPELLGQADAGDAALSVPGLAAGVVLALAGIVSVAIAFVRRP